MSGNGPLAMAAGLGVRLPPDLLAALDSYIASDLPAGTSRPEALRLAFRDWAIGHGLMPPDPER